MRFLVLGAGSLGSYFGGLLLQGGADVSFLVRPKRAAELAEQGLVIKLPDGHLRQRVRTLLAGRIDGRYDVVLLACKTYDLESAIEAVAPALGEDSAILPVLNGIGHITTLADRFGRDRVLGGLTNVAAARSPEGEVIRLPGTLGTTIFGELTGTRTARCADIQHAFAAGGVPTEISDSIIAEMWVKLFGFATVAAIANPDPGKSRRDRHCARLARLCQLGDRGVCAGHHGRRLPAAGCDEGQHPRALRPARLDLFPIDIA